MDEACGIGKQNQLPWYMPSDLKRFKALTMGHHLVMGRKTFETIGKPLPGRTMIIVTRRIDYLPEGHIVTNSLTGALKIAEERNETEVFVIGGGQIFKQAINLANRIYMTIINARTEADIYFPPFDSDDWETVYSEDVAQNEKDEYKSDFMVLERRNSFE